MPLKYDPVKSAVLGMSMTAMMEESFECQFRTFLKF